MQKVTVILPRSLVEEAVKATGAGLTPTIRQALEAIVRRQAYQGLLQMRGKVRLSINLDELRQD
jgi:hypothetical protein